MWLQPTAGPVNTIRSRQPVLDCQWSRKLRTNISLTRNLLGPTLAFNLSADNGGLPMGQVDWLGLGAPILSVIFARIEYICISSKKLHAIRKHVSLWGSGFSVAMQSPDIASIQFAALLTRFPNLAHQPADDDEVAALASTSDGCVLRPFGCSACSASERHRATIALAMVKCHLWRLSTLGDKVSGNAVAARCGASLSPEEHAVPCRGLLPSWSRKSRTKISPATGATGSRRAFSMPPAPTRRLPSRFWQRCCSE